LKLNKLLDAQVAVNYIIENVFRQINAAVKRINEFYFKYYQYVIIFKNIFY